MPNPNGPDSAITINLSIKDTDHSGTITLVTRRSLLPQILRIPEGSWQIPSGFTGHIWVKIVAVGPRINVECAYDKREVWDPLPGNISTDTGILVGDMIEALFRAVDTRVWVPQLRE